jgi:hemolysin activation/secretion protein
MLPVSAIARHRPPDSVSARIFLAVLTIVLMAHALTCGAQVPDAGQLLQQQNKADQDRRQAPSKSADEVAGRPAAATQERQQSQALLVRVKAFRITDDAGGLFPFESLLAPIRNFIGKEQSLADLERAAGIVTRHYQDHGYFLARAHLPQQEIADGVVAIHVIVGSLELGNQGEHILIRPASLRVSEQIVRRILAGTAGSGEPLRLADLEHGVLLLNDLPGVTARIGVVPGSVPGAARLEVDAAEGSLFGANVGVDNQGYRQTGAARASALFSLNDPLTIGDAISVSMASAGSGMNYGRLSYRLPIGYRGFKVGLSYSHLQYKLGKELKSLEAKGKADTASLFASFPVVRSRMYNLSVDLSLDHKQLYNEAAGATTSDKVGETATLNVTSDLWDGLLGGGVTSLDVNATYGRLKLDGWAMDLLVDSVTARTQGSYTKLGLSLTRHQRIAGPVSLYASVSGQRSSKNLDSSEKLTLGGAAGVRAYPYGEGSGDEGHIASAELRWDMRAPLSGSTLRVFGFYDTGTISLHKEPWNSLQAGSSGARNSYSLHGTGIGVAFAKNDRFSLRATYARKVGNNPNPTASGTDGDGTNDGYRVWVQAGVSF